MTWRERAACRDEDPELFFSNPGENNVRAQARAVCAGCVVVEECLADALAFGPGLAGIWGGTSEKQRKRLRQGVLRSSLKQ